MANSQWLQDVLVAIATISVGTANDPALIAKVDALTARLGTDEGNTAASNAEFQTAIAALVAALHAAPKPPLPAVLAVSKATGSVNGGETVVLTVSGGTGTSAVNFGNVAATSFTVDSDTQITAVTPAQGAGSVDVTITTPAGVSVAVTADQYLYV